MIQKNEFGEFNSPYAAEAINAAIEAAELSQGYMPAIRDICREFNYSLYGFHKWLIRRGVIAKKSKYRYERKKEEVPAIQFVINFNSKEKEIVEKYMYLGGAANKTDFVRKAVKEYLKAITKAVPELA